jgi:hypothetical protein
MKTKSILISLSSMLLLTCGTAKINPSIKTNETASEEPLKTTEEKNVAELPVKEQFVDSSASISFIDSTLIVNPWEIIAPPPYEPWEIIIPQPYPYEWFWGITSSVYFIVNSRQEDENDRIYNHIIQDKNCYQYEKVNNRLQIELDILEETTLNLSILEINNISHPTQTTPNWLNQPVCISGGQHKVSVPYHQNISKDFRISLKSNGIEEDFSVRI